MACFLVGVTDCSMNVLQGKGLWSCTISWIGIQLAKAGMYVYALDNVWSCIKLNFNVKTMYQYVDAYAQISMQLYNYMEFTPYNDRVYSYTCSPASWVGGGGPGSWPELPPSYLLPNVTNSLSPMTMIILRPSLHWPPEVKSSSSALWWPSE